MIVEKVWGTERHIVNRMHCGKVMTLKAGFRCSLHYHQLKDETFLVTKGRVLMELGVIPAHADIVARLWYGSPSVHVRTLELGPGDVVDVPPMTPHRFTGLEDSEFIEFSTHDDPEDSIRFTRSEKVPEHEMAARQ